MNGIIVTVVGVMLAVFLSFVGVLLKSYVAAPALRLEKLLERLDENQDKLRQTLGDVVKDVQKLSDELFRLRGEHDVQIKRFNNHND